MFCYEDLKDDYSVLKVSRQKKPSTTYKGNVIKKESEIGHFAQMMAMLSGIGLGLLNSKSTFAQGYSEVKYNIQVTDPLNSGQMIPVNATGDMVDKVTSAFDPLINVMVGLSLPIAGVMLTAGALLIMIGQKDMGYKLLMNCGMGYVLVNLTPLGMDILQMVGDAISKGA